MKMRLLGFLVFCLMGTKIFAQQTSKDFFERGTVKYHLEDYKAAILDFDQGIEIAHSNQFPKNKKKKDNPAYDKQLASAYLKRGMCKIKLNDKKNGCMDIDKALYMGDEKAYREKEKFCKEN